MSDEQIKYMVERFLGWKLPEDFNPDDGISFKRFFNEHLPTPMKHEPIGTNLFNYDQARAMVRYMIEGMPIPEPEAPLKDWCPECGEPGNERRDLSLGKTWRQCESCYQEWFTDIDYPHRIALKPPKDADARKWLLLPDTYQPDTKDSREDSGLNYSKWYSKSAYEKLERELEAWKVKNDTLRWDKVEAELIAAEEERDRALGMSERLSAALEHAAGQLEHAGYTKNAAPGCRLVLEEYAKFKLKV